MNSCIRITNARTHNLKGVDLEIPHHQLTVITGVSGSGKSSLAIDTLYAEGQRQYIESLSTYARQFLHQLQRPDVEAIEGMQPTLCIDQQGSATNPRSTVATVTEVYDYLRLLMARVGIPSCFSCGKPIVRQSVEQIQADLMSLPERTKLVLMAPVVRGRRGAHRDELNEIRRRVWFACGSTRSSTRWKKFQIWRRARTIRLRQWSTKSSFGLAANSVWPTRFKWRYGWQKGLSREAI